MPYFFLSADDGQARRATAGCGYAKASFVKKNPKNIKIIEQGWLLIYNTGRSIQQPKERNIGNNLNIGTYS